NTGKYDLDVIIPCYNVEKYVRLCIDSIMNMDYKCNVRIIIIDDGSEDATGNIIDEYAGRKNILIIHQENQGLSGARNAGLLEVNADYVMFLDSDDYIVDGNLDAILEFAYSENVDIIEGKMVTLSGNVIDYAKDNSFEFVEINRHKATGYACGKIFKTTLFDNVSFPAGYWFEDGIIRYLIMPRCEKIYGFNGLIYAYRQNEEGISYKSRGNIKSIDAYWLREIIFDDMKKLGIEITQELYEMLIDEIALTFVRTSGLEQNVKISIFYLTAEWFRPLHKRFRSRNRFHYVLEKGLELENFQTYADGCGLLWNSRIVQVDV
nr:glycosyltransferase family 2 protein [Lachnospiraceae bacterium]